MQSKLYLKATWNNYFLCLASSTIWYAFWFICICASSVFISFNLIFWNRNPTPERNYATRWVSRTFASRLRFPRSKQFYSFFSLPFQTCTHTRAGHFPDSPRVPLGPLQKKGRSIAIPPQASPFSLNSTSWRLAHSPREISAPSLCLGAGPFRVSARIHVVTLSRQAPGCLQGFASVKGSWMSNVVCAACFCHSASGNVC